MKRLRKILIVAGIFLGAAILISVLHHYQLRFAVEKYTAELKAKGEPMELAEVVPPAVPPERNGADILLQAERLLQQDKTFLTSNYIPAMSMVMPGKAVVSFRQPEVRAFGEYGFTNSWDEAQEALQKNQEALTILEQIISRPEVDFHIRYELGFIDASFFTNSHLVAFKKAAQLLKNSSVYALHEDNTDLAVKNVKASLILANAMRSQRTVIAELVRIAVVTMAQGATWEILQSTNLTDAQLSILQADWAKIDFLQSYQDALSLEGVVSKRDLTKMRASDAELKKLTDIYDNAYEMLHGDDDENSSLLKKIINRWEIFQWRYWWSYDDELKSLKCHIVLVEAVREAKTTDKFLAAFQKQVSQLDKLGIQKYGDILESVFTSRSNLRTLQSQSMATLSPAFKKLLKVESLRRTTVTAVALKRFQLKHGNFPEKISELAPEFLAATPLDAVDGQPLRYQRNADGTYLLYSIGNNGVDDGGNPAFKPGSSSTLSSWQHRDALDWVWPQPATDAEVKLFFDHPPK